MNDPPHLTVDVLWPDLREYLNALHSHLIDCGHIEFAKRIHHEATKSPPTTDDLWARLHRDLRLIALHLKDRGSANYAAVAILCAKAVEQFYHDTHTGGSASESRIIELRSLLMKGGVEEEP